MERSKKGSTQQTSRTSHLFIHTHLHLHKYWSLCLVSLFFFCLFRHNWFHHSNVRKYPSSASFASHSTSVTMKLPIISTHNKMVCYEHAHCGYVIISKRHEPGSGMDASNGHVDVSKGLMDAVNVPNDTKMATIVLRTVVTVWAWNWVLLWQCGLQTS